MKADRPDESRCDQCQTIFAIPSRIGRIPRFCSKKCSHRWHDDRRPATHPRGKVAK